MYSVNIALNCQDLHAKIYYGLFCSSEKKEEWEHIHSLVTFFAPSLFKVERIQSRKENIFL